MWLLTRIKCCIIEWACFFSVQPFQNFQKYWVLVTTNLCNRISKFLWLFDNDIGLEREKLPVYLSVHQLLEQKKKEKRENSWNPDAGKNTNYLPHFTRRQNQTKKFEPIKIVCDTHAILYKHCATISQ